MKDPHQDMPDRTPDLNGKTFRARSNSANGEVGPQTLFRYCEADGMVWAEYSGGSIQKGQIIGRRLPDHSLDLRYQHASADGTLKTGICKSTVHVGSDGKLVLKEAWQWTCGDGSQGESEIEEL